MASESGSRSQVGVAIAFVPQCGADQGFSRESDAFDDDFDCDPDSDPDSASIEGLCRSPGRPRSLRDSRSRLRHNRGISRFTYSAGNPAQASGGERL